MLRIKVGFHLPNTHKNVFVLCHLSVVKPLHVRSGADMSNWCGVEPQQRSLLEQHLKVCVHFCLYILTLLSVGLVELKHVHIFP